MRNTVGKLKKGIRKGLNKGLIFAVTITHLGFMYNVSTHGLNKLYKQYGANNCNITKQRLVDRTCDDYRML